MSSAMSHPIATAACDGKTRRGFTSKRFRFFDPSDRGVSSIQPDDGRCQMDRGEEISSGFVVTCRDSAEFLEVAEEVLNEVTRLESRFVIGALVFAIAPGWD